MKTIYPIIVFIIFITNIHAQTIPNSGFENWTNYGTYSNPNSWESFNQLYPASGSCVQGTPGFVGTSYLKLTTIASGTLVLSGMAFTGNNIFQNTPGFPYSLRSANFNGEYQCFPGTGDYGAVIVTLTKWNTLAGKRDTIATGLSILLATTGWTSFTIPMTYSNAANPDSASIYLESSAIASPVVGSMLYVDNLSFSGTVAAGIQEMFDNTSVSIGPNPFSTQTQVTFGLEKNNINLTITDITGKEVKQLNLSGCKEIIIEKGDMKQGVYFLQITDEKKNVMRKKIIIQ